MNHVYENGVNNALDENSLVPGLMPLSLIVVTLQNNMTLFHYVL